MVVRWSVVSCRGGYCAGGRGFGVRLSVAREDLIQRETTN
jgi:hypothetical protein